MAAGLAAPVGAEAAQRSSAESHRAAKPSRPAAASAQAPRQGGQQARQASHASAHAARATRHQASAAHSGRRHGIRQASYGSYGGGLSCVPYARMVTGMTVSGNGGQWWHNAAGTYDRGNRPERGSVLVFRSSGGMSRGHVAVVSQVVGPRHVLIDHANWGGPGIRRGSVMRGVSVVDVSDRNDWTEVRVQVGHDTTNYGRSYPTYGFIHNRPDRGAMMAFGGDRQPAATSVRFDQVAELPLLEQAAASSRRSTTTRRR